MQSRFIKECIYESFPVFYKYTLKIEKEMATRKKKGHFKNVLFSIHGTINFLKKWVHSRMQQIQKK